MAEFACGDSLAIAAVPLFCILPLIKPTNQMVKRLFGFSPTGFDTTLLGQYFLSGYFWAMATATLLSMVAAIAKLQPFR